MLKKIKKISAIIMVLLTATSLIISSRLLFHYKFLADRYNLSLMKLVGGDTWLLIELVNLFILSIIFINSVINCIAILKEKNKK